MPRSRYPEEIEYSEKYNDDEYEYRHVILTKDAGRAMWKILDRNGRGLLNVSEYRSLGVEIACGWEHFMVHRPEPHILCLRRPWIVPVLVGSIDLERRAPKGASSEAQLNEFLWRRAELSDIATPPLCRVVWRCPVLCESSFYLDIDSSSNVAALRNHLATLFRILAERVCLHVSKGKEVLQPVEDITLRELAEEVTVGR